LTGALSGVFASHCAAPVMVALLAIVAQAEHGLLWGIFLMFLYAVGHSILLVIAGTSYGVVDGWIRNPKYDKISKRLRIVLGAVILLIGLMMLLA
jgi:cytochrome c-type biogenesis protein